MSEPVCANCGCVVLPSARTCPFCRRPIALAPAPARAPSPRTAPEPAKVCANCRGSLGVPQRVPIPQLAARPLQWDAYICARCGRVELYEARD
ncbi:MAG TPA: hypothetical protein VGV89_03115 [Thermoplasmata archaeon]|nr:hypothetical protein [Thermoplasmata archaeon]